MSENEQGASLERWLARLAPAEGQAPRALAEILSELGEQHLDSPKAAALLAAYAQAERKRSWLDAQSALYNRFGWRLIRPLIGIGLLAFPVFVFQKGVDPALGFSLFLLGAVSFYLLLQAYLHWWTRRAEKMRDSFEAELPAQLTRLLESDEPGQEH